MSTSEETPAVARPAGARFALDRARTGKTWRRFHGFNRERLRRLRECLSQRQQDCLELLPLLFHTNHPLMPGYVGRDAPHGLSGYQPSAHTLTRATRLVRSFTYRRRALRQFGIQAVYLMGSTGTIGQSSGSDFDVWLCHDPQLAPEAVDKLQLKTHAITRWAETLGMEMHFFLMVPERFRAGALERLSGESSGTAQHHLLLDEFYRTGLLLAGRSPAWWLVPPEYENDYEDYLAALIRGRFVKKEDLLDFGPVATVRAAEFLGATLWQLFKGVASPHKSVLKILLLESYANGFPAIDLLSQRYKRAVYAGETELDAVDPYVSLLRKVEDYLLTMGDGERLELARHCFYFKANLRMSDPRAFQADHWRSALLQRLVQAWGWSGFKLADLDRRRGWKIDRVMEEQKALVNALTVSYRALSRFAREHAEFSMVSKRDMTILGRKLFTVFEHKAGKVELVNLGISSDLGESHLSIHQVRPRDDQEFWLLYRGTVRPGEVPPGETLKRAWTLLEVVAWCHFNGLLTPNTRVLVCTVDSGADTRDVDTLLSHLREHFPRSLARGAGIDELAAQPGMLATSTFVNLGVDPLEGYTRRGRSLTTTRTDALSYSGWHENLVRVVDYMVVSTWHEIMTFKFHGLEGLMACLCEHLRWVSRTLTAGIDVPRCGCYAPGYGDTITRRVAELFDAVTTWFTRPGAASARRYVIRGGDHYYALAASGEIVSHAFSGTLGELLRHLGQPSEHYTDTSIDPQALDDTPLPLIYAGNREDVVQFHYLPLGKHAQVYVLDEHGALFYDEVSFHSHASLLGQYERFFEAVQHRQSSLSPPAPGQEEVLHAPGERTGAVEEPCMAPRVEFHQLSQDTAGGFRRQRVEPAAGAGARGYFDVKVIGETAAGGTRCTLYCNGHEFSTREYGGRLFAEVADHILAHRSGGEPYPIYITDIDLSRMDAERGGQLQTVHYLRYKKRMEEYLNRAMSEGR